MLTAAVAAEFARRRQRNPRYSLRAFARDVGVHHGTLSRLLRGRLRLTATVARTLGARLAVPSALIEASWRAADDAAILEAVRRRDFRPDSRWLATRTGLALDAVNAALHRALRRGELVMSAPDRWEVRCPTRL